MMTIDHDAERTEAQPHDLGCFETYAEELVEAGIAQTGDYTEIIGGMMVINRFHQDMVTGTATCNCRTTEEW